MAALLALAVSPTRAERAPAAVEEELATPMGQLQQLTHKLSLATQARNVPLSRFYLEESISLIEEIQVRIPEYQNLPIAVHLERFAIPPYRQMQVILRVSNDELDPGALDPAMDAIIDSCNACHRATNYGFIRIRRSTENPFNQDFSAQGSR